MLKWPQHPPLLLWSHPVPQTAPGPPTPMLQEEVHSGNTPKENDGTRRQTQPGPSCFALSYNLARLHRLQAPLSPCSGSCWLGKPLGGLINILL